MVGLSAFYVSCRTLPPVVAVFNGLQTIVVAIVANATVSFGKTSLKEFGAATIAIFAAGMFGLGVSPIVVILLAGLLGIVILKDTAVAKLGVGSASNSRSMGSLS